MMTNQEFNEYLDGYPISLAGKEYLRNAFTNGPSRNVKSGITNIVSYVYSKKLGHTVQSESITGERCAILEYEDDPDVLWYGDQAPAVRVRGIKQNGKVGGWVFRPDFVVARLSTGPSIEEIKSEKKIQKFLSNGHPAWRMDEVNNVHYLPGEEHFKLQGIPYCIRSTASFNQILAANRKVTLASRKTPSLDPRLVKKIRCAVQDSSYISLSELAIQLSLESIEPLIKMIDSKQLYADKENQLLWDPENSFVSLSQEHFELSRSYLGGISDLNMIGKEIVFPSQQDLQIARSRLQAINKNQKGRSVRRWEKKVSDGAKEMKSAIQSLIPTPLPGNKTARLPVIVEEVISEAIEVYYATPKRSRVKSCHGRYRVLAKQRHPEHDPVSYPTFLKRLKSEDPSTLALKRGGKRHRNSVSPTSQVESRSIVVKLAFMLAHIDAHLCKIFLIWGEDSKNSFTRRPWLTLMIDRGTSQVLGYHLTFGNPSRLSLGAVLRDCVRRFGKLPEEIFVDHGPENTSAYLADVVAGYEGDLSFRPVAQSKSGSEVERIFKEFMDSWLDQRPGNMVQKAYVRGIDGKFSASEQALMRPEQFIAEFDQFLAWRANKLRGAKTVTAEQSFSDSVQAYPFIGKKIAYDEKFVIETAVDTKDYTIGSNDVKINALRYSHPALAQAKLKKSLIDIRIDPENPYVAYARVENRWVVCTATGVVEFNGKTLQSKRAEAMRIIGAGPLRQAAQESAAEELAILLLSADKVLEANGTFYIEVVGAEDVQSDDSVDNSSAASQPVAQKFKGFPVVENFDFKSLNINQGDEE
ncbi:MAG: hypothetical protein EOO53_01805 [Gammaproteobacteria bacterium]|nr:MAG: hypothetical protein EOO53_01805 [Gammaproteobacteria bacterium]